jgi:hypothetical protein
LPPALRPNSEAGSTRSDAAVNVRQDLIKSVIERWRSATMNYKGGQESDVADFAPVPAATVAPAMPTMPAAPAPAASPDPRRSGLLRRPLDAPAPVGTAAGTPRFR